MNLCWMMKINLIYWILQKVLKNEEVLSGVIDVLEASKGLANLEARMGKYARELRKETVKKSLNDTEDDDLDYVKRRKAAMRSGKYGSQYDKMSDEEKRKRNIKLNRALGIGSPNERGEKKRRGYINPYINRSITSPYSVQSDIRDQILNIRKNNSTNSTGSVNKIITDEHNLFTKGQIINDMKKKYKDNPEKLDKVKAIRAKYGHTLEASN